MTDHSSFTRRDFLKMTTVTALGLAFASADGNAQEGEIGMASVKPTGEPYGLAGKRLVFTNWYYVRPGLFSWVDDKGETVTVVGAQGPWGAHFRRRDCPHGIRIVAQPAKRTGPLLQNEKRSSFNTVMSDGGIFRAWGAGHYESKDGLKWERSEIQFDFSIGNGTVFKDPSAPDTERYKWVAEERISREEFEAYRKRRPDGWEPRCYRPDVDQGTFFAVRGAVSPDGLHWTMLPEPLVVEHSDTQVTCYYDERLRKYVLYTRNYMIGPRSERAQDENFRSWWEIGRRSIGRSESDDFRNFPLSEVIIEPGPEMLPSDLLYTNCRTAIPGAPDHHLMFPAIWHAAVDDTTSIALASSHNGKLWHFVPGPPVLETAPFGEWDGGCVFAQPNLVELPNGDFALPYTGFNFPHKYPRGQLECRPGYALWPKGRLVALEAPEMGEFATVGIIPPGRKLKINALVQRAGSILVEVADLDRNPIPGRAFADATPIIGDQHWTPVTWKDGDDLGHKDGSAIILRFRMDKARIFGLEFE